MQKIAITIIFLLIFSGSYAVNKKEILSPDGKIKLIVEAKEHLTYSVSYENRIIVLPSIINLTLENGMAISGNTDFKKISFTFQ